MKDYNEMAQELFERREAYLVAKQKRTKKILGIGIPLVCVCLIGAIGTATFNVYNKPFPDVTSSHVSVSNEPSLPHSPSAPSSLPVVNMPSSLPSVSIQNSIPSDISINSPTSDVVSQNSHFIPPKNAVLKLQYSNIGDLVLDLRDLVGVKDQNIPSFLPPENLIPGAVVSGDNGPTASPKPDVGGEDVETNPPTSGGSDVDAMNPPPTGGPGDTVVGDAPPQEWEEPFQNPSTEEEKEQKNLWDRLFVDGCFYAPTLGAGNNDFQLYQLEVSDKGLCYYYVNIHGSYNESGSYDLVVRIPLENSDVVIPGTSGQNENPVYAIIEKSVQTDNAASVVKFHVYRVNGSNNHFKFFWNQGEKCYTADYYGSSDIKCLEKLVALLVIQGHAWD